METDRKSKSPRNNQKKKLGVSRCETPAPAELRCNGAQDGLEVKDKPKSPVKRHSGQAGQLMYSPEELAVKCKQYLAECDDNGRKPTWQGLAGYLDVISETLTVWLKDDNRVQTPATAAVSATLKKAADAMSDRLQQRTDSMALLSVNQPIFGGFTNRPQEANIGSVAVNFTFVRNDGKPDGNA